MAYRHQTCAEHSRHVDRHIVKGVKVGFRVVASQIFAGAWESTEQAFDDTIANLLTAATTAMLDELIDIDDAEAFTR